jgi:hypothetical protein
MMISWNEQDEELREEKRRNELMEKEVQRRIKQLEQQSKPHL